MLVKYGQLDIGRVLPIMVYLEGGFLKIGIPTGGDCKELLWIPVHERKPAALDLDHYPVALFEGMGNFIETKGYFCRFSRFKGLRLLIAVAKLAPEHFCPYQPFKSG